jgi:DNA invertase Pin-like site-specific DNA recombinase
LPKQCTGRWERNGQSRYKEITAVTLQKHQSTRRIAVGYVRCSTDEQGATSIPQQKQELERWAAANDFEIVEWFVDEGKSGTSFLARPGFAELVKRVEHDPDFSYVLVYDESRWGRALNPRENAYWKVHFERFKVKVRIIHSSSKNGDDIGSYVMEVVESAEASEYSKKLSRAVRRGMLSAQQGIYSRGGTAPYGYVRIAVDLTTGERRELREGMRSAPRQEKVVWGLGKPEEVETVRRIFELRAEGLGYVAIANILNAEGVPSPKRGRWRNRDQKWCGVTVNGIITNLTYTGARVYNRLSFSKILANERGYVLNSRRQNDREEWIIVKNAHPAIVSKELFDQANALEQQETRGYRPRYSASEYLLTGLVRCSRCQFNFQGFHHTKSGVKYYVDGGYINKGKSVCTWFSVRKEVLERFVLQSVKEVLLVPPLLERVRSKVQELIRNEPHQIQQRIHSISQVIKENESKIENLMRLAEEGGSVKTVAARLRELEEIQEKLKEEQLRLQKHYPHKEREMDIVREVSSFLENFETNILTARIEEKKELLRKVVEKIVVDRERRKVSCYVRVLPKLPTVRDFSRTSTSLLGQKVALTGIEPVFQP